MDWDALHIKAKNALPHQELPPKRYWIGVLIHDRSPDQQLQEGDFIWMKAHAKISVDTIAAKYGEKYHSVDFELKFQHEAPEKTLVRDMNCHGDNIIIFRALQKQTRLPLLSGHQVLAQPEAIQSMAHDSETESCNTPARERFNEASSFVAPAAKMMSAVPLTPVSTNKENTAAAPWHARRSPATTSPNLVYTPHLFKTPTNISEPHQHSAAKWGYAYAASPTQIAQDQSTPMPSLVEQETRPNVPRQSAELVPTSIAFNPEDFFKVEQSPTAEYQSEPIPTDVYMRKLIEQRDPELLEAGVVQAMEVLDTLRRSFVQYSASSADAEAWIKAIDKVKVLAERKRTVVGVVGNTGAGKSSVINAMLDEERLVPTNCMRACTAVVTEISWNDSTDVNSKYSADIEFIARADWEKELNALMKEILTENGTVCREASDPNSDAGIAWAKFHAVYPKKTKEMFADTTVDSLMAEKSVLNVLGTTQRISEPKAEPFYRKLQQYVDSKEKVTGKKDKNKDKNTPKYQMEYWPLIKVVKIRTKSNALSTGAVIVDLPGVHDSNAARAAVAQGYMKQCTGLWIVAPITRAVDDKTAKMLLGDSFKRQLKYDGGFANVTFICSKTDDISITEATDSLELEERMAGLESQERDQKRKINSLKENISELQESLDAYHLAYDSAVDDIETWEDLKDKINLGRTVYAPIDKAIKRKRSSFKVKSRKKRYSGTDSEDAFALSDGGSSNSDRDSGRDSGSDSDTKNIQILRTPLTEEDVDAKLQELKETKKNARRLRNEFGPKVQELRSGIKEAKALLTEVRAEMSAICIAGRNEYSKLAIQRDFAAGIRELDQENAAEEDEEHFNPDEELRDYDMVASSLPVFCVSSRAYQKICGRLQKDDTVPGFKTVEETEIPQLQAHCKKLTEAGRIQTSRNFLLSLCQQLNTFSFWASDDGSGLKLSDEEKRMQFNYLEKLLKELERGLEKAIESCINSMKKEMHDQIFEKYPEVIEDAITAAPITAQRWGAHRSEGGLYWATYKAVVRRDGMYHSSSAGLRDFNQELIEPIIKRLATSWERTFSNRLPKAFEIYATDSSKLLRAFHEKVEERARENGAGIANLANLKAQIFNYEQSFQQIYTLLVTSMTELQRDANRDFTPTIVAIMHTVYDTCTYEHGSGSFMRMKGHMNTHVGNHRHHMFHDATKTVREHLDSMCKNLQNTMESKADEIFDSMRRDYLTVLGGAMLTQGVTMSKEERTIRTKIMTLLLDVDDRFKKFTEEEATEITERDSAGKRYTQKKPIASMDTKPTADTESSITDVHCVAVEKTNNVERVDV